MTIKDIVDVLSKAITAAATVLAGGWAYYRFVKGRVFHPRLILHADAQQLRIEATTYLLSTIELSNVGLSRIDINTATLRICSLSAEAVPDVATLPNRAWLDTSRVLLAHSWIESGEVLKEQNLLALPLDHRSPVVIDFRVVSQGVSFVATAIAQPASVEQSTAASEGN
jgi:hypothetical protein